MSDHPAGTVKTSPDKVAIRTNQPLGPQAWLVATVAQGAYYVTADVVEEWPPL